MGRHPGNQRNLPLGLALACAFAFAGCTDSSSSSAPAAAATPSLSVASVTPASGPVAGGTSITIAGTGFQAGATVDVGGTTATGVSVVSATQVTATTPAATAAGAVSVTVTNPGGAAGSLVSGFTYTAGAPILSAVSPSSGPTAGGTAITLTGLNFQGGATVSVGGAAATNVVVQSATQATATTPPGFAGAVNVTITNPGGSNGVLMNGFTYLGPTPTVTVVSPSFGTTAGGTAVTLTGTNFLTGATITFGGTQATNVTVVSAIQATCTTPAGSAGAVNVTLTNPGGSSGVKVSGYTYTAPPTAPPTISAVTPNAGPAAGGTGITIGGTNFISGATVSVGGTAATNVVVVSPTIITCTTPAGAIGAATIVVTNPGGGAGSSPGAFTYSGNPTVTAVNPTSGSTLGGNAVSITGANFVAGATVQLGTAAATITSFNTTLLVVTAPAGTAGTVGVTVTNPGGYATTLASAYTYTTPPTVSAVSPNTGPAIGGTAVTITGTNFNAGATVQFGTAAAASVTVVSATVITATTPAGSAGAVTVTVTDPSSAAGSLANAFTYVAPPTVFSVSPGSGPAAGGTAVTISGTGFQNGATVTFGGNAATNVSFVSANSLTATTTAGTVGSVTVQVTNPDTQVGSLAAGYNYTPPPPTVTAISPATGYTNAYTWVTITGTGFAAGATADIGGTLLINLSVVNSTTISARVQPKAAGTYTLTVTNTGGAAPGSLANAFTYVAPPPLVYAVYTNVGQLGGGATVTISGANFQTGATVAFGSVPATNITINGSWSITCTVPPATAPGYVTVTVTNPTSGSGSRTNAYYYYNGLTVAGVYATGATSAGGSTVTVTGYGFQSGMTVTVNGLTATNVTVNTEFQLTFTLPQTVAGPATLGVTVPTAYTGQLTTGYVAQTLTRVNAFTVAGATTPSATAPVVPSEGGSAGGATVTLTGSGFQSGATVLFGSVQATGVTFVSSSTITCTVPAHGFGDAPVVAVTVTNPDATTWSVTPPVAGYTYTRMSCGGGSATYALQKDPRVAVGANGARHLAFVEETWGGTNWVRNLRYRLSTDAGQTWGSSITFASASTAATTVQTGWIAVAARGSDVVVVWSLLVWNSGTAGWESEPWIASSTDGGQTFSTGSQLSSLARSTAPGWMPYDVAIAPDGTVVVAAEAKTTGGTSVFVTSGSSASNLGTPVQVSATGGAVIAPRLVATQNSTWHLVWQEGVGSTTTVDFAQTTDGGSTWSSPASLSAPGLVHSASVSANSGRVVVGWGLHGTSGCTYRQTTDGGATWTTAATVGGSATVSAAYPTAIVVDSGATLVAVWLQPASTLWSTLDQVYESTSTDGGSTWSTPALISRTYYYYGAGAPDIDTDGTDRFTVFTESPSYYGLAFGY